jgi:hypothetical protein
MFVAVGGQRRWSKGARCMLWTRYRSAVERTMSMVVGEEKREGMNGAGAEVIISPV